jgi:hypothetical protein
MENRFFAGSGFSRSRIRNRDPAFSKNRPYPEKNGFKKNSTGTKPKVRKYLSSSIREFCRGEGDFVFGMVVVSLLGSLEGGVGSRALDCSLLNESCNQ